MTGVLALIAAWCAVTLGVVGVVAGRRYLDRYMERVESEEAEPESEAA